MTNPTDRELIAQALDALVYHQQQTRPIDRTEAAIVAIRAALASPVHVEPVGLTEEQNLFLRFLCGTAMFQGCWFEQHNPKEQGKFWWRQHLYRLFGESALAKPPDSA